MSIPFGQLGFWFPRNLELSYSLLAFLKNSIKFIFSKIMIYLTALSIMDAYRLTSIFDAIHAATALSTKVPDHIIISTDKKYDAIRGLKRIDPRKLKLEA